MTSPALNTAPDMTFRKRAGVTMELTLSYRVDNGPVRQYRNKSSHFTVRNVRVWVNESGWQVTLAGTNTVTGLPIGEGQILGDNLALANEKTMGWLRPIIEDARERYAAALEQADR